MQRTKDMSELAKLLEQERAEKEANKSTDTPTDTPTDKQAKSRVRQFTDKHPYFDKALEALGSAKLADAIGYTQSAVQNLANGNRGVLYTVEVACKAVVMEMEQRAPDLPPTVFLFTGSPTDQKVQALIVTAQSLGIKISKLEV